jgi:hypothetical protein
MVEQPNYIGYEELQSMSNLIGKDDKVLLRYEMIREQIATNASITSVSQKYGYNSRHFYWCRKRFQEGGIVGLVDRPPGPKEPYKIKPDVEKRILHFRKKNLSIYEISGELKKEDINITPKSVDNVLDKHHKPKKNRGRKPTK